MNAIIIKQICFKLPHGDIKPCPLVESPSVISLPGTMKLIPASYF